MAEGVGFEPTREQNPLPVFKTGALNRSATLPALQLPNILQPIRKSLMILLRAGLQDSALRDRACGA